MNAPALRRALQESEAGRLTFPQVVEALATENVESYLVDLVRGIDTFYMTDGEAAVEKMSTPPRPVAVESCRAGVLSAIRAAQADQMRYPEFLRRATQAGVTAYWVFIRGRRVIYFGRAGETHVEEFTPFQF